MISTKCAQIYIRNIKFWSNTLLIAAIATVWHQFCYKIISVLSSVVLFLKIFRLTLEHCLRRDTLLNVVLGSAESVTLYFP